MVLAPLQCLPNDKPHWCPLPVLHSFRCGTCPRSLLLPGFDRLDRQYDAAQMETLGASSAEEEAVSPTTHRNSDQITVICGLRLLTRLVRAQRDCLAAALNIECEVIIGNTRFATATRYR